MADTESAWSRSLRAVKDFSVKPLGPAPRWVWMVLGVVALIVLIVVIVVATKPATAAAPAEEETPPTYGTGPVYTHTLSMVGGDTATASIVLAESGSAHATVEANRGEGLQLVPQDGGVGLRDGGTYKLLNTAGTAGMNWSSFTTASNGNDVDAGPYARWVAVSNADVLTLQAVTLSSAEAVVYMHNGQGGWLANDWSVSNFTNLKIRPMMVPSTKKTKLRLYDPSNPIVDAAQATTQPTSQNTPSGGAGRLERVQLYEP